MPVSLKSIEMYNKVYAIVRSKIPTARGISFVLHTFDDCTSIVRVNGFGGKSSSVTSMVAIVPLYNEEKEIIGYRLSADSVTKEVKNLQECGAFLSIVVRDIRILISKIKR